MNVLNQSIRVKTGMGGDVVLVIKSNRLDCEITLSQSSAEGLACKLLAKACRAKVSAWLSDDGWQIYE